MSKIQLLTCEDKRSTSQRIIVEIVLVDEPNIVSMAPNVIFLIIEWEWENVSSFYNYLLIKTKRKEIFPLSSYKSINWIAWFQRQEYCGLAQFGSGSHPGDVDGVFWWSAGSGNLLKGPEWVTGWGGSTVLSKPRGRRVKEETLTKGKSKCCHQKTLKAAMHPKGKNKLG